MTMKLVFILLFLVFPALSSKKKGIVDVNHKLSLNHEMNNSVHLTIQDNTCFNKTKEKIFEKPETFTEKLAIEDHKETEYAEAAEDNHHQNNLVSELNEKRQESKLLRQRIQQLQRENISTNVRLQVADAEKQNTERRLHEVEEQNKTVVEIKDCEARQLKSKLLDAELYLDCAIDRVVEQQSDNETNLEQIRLMWKELQENEETMRILKEQCQVVCVLKDTIIQRIQVSNSTLQKEHKKNRKNLKQSEKENRDLKKRNEELQEKIQTHIDFEKDNEERINQMEDELESVKIEALVRKWQNKIVCQVVCSFKDTIIQWVRISNRALQKEHKKSMIILKRNRKKLKQSEKEKRDLKKRNKVLLEKIQKVPLKWEKLNNIAWEKNMPELMKIDPNAKTDDERVTILHMCASYSWVEGVKYLMSCKPKPDLMIKNIHGVQAFHMIGLHRRDAKAAKDNLEVLKLFLNNGQDVNAIGGEGESILITSVMCQWKESVQYLLDNAKVDLNHELIMDVFRKGVKATKGDTAIKIAMKENLNDIVTILEKKTPVLRVTNNDLKDPLRDVNTLYYLRYLSDQEFKKNKRLAFSTVHPETGNYLGYKESKVYCENVGIGERSEFKIKYDPDGKTFRVYCAKKDQLEKDAKIGVRDNVVILGEKQAELNGKGEARSWNHETGTWEVKLKNGGWVSDVKPENLVLSSNLIERILSWSQSVGTGYYMYKSNKIWDDADKYTRFTYNDDDYSFFAAPYGKENYQLGVCECAGHTAIYRRVHGGEKNTKFCFQKVNQ